MAVADIQIRPVRAADRATLLRFIAGFQDYERGLHPNRRPSAEVTEGYLAEMEREMAANHGAMAKSIRPNTAISFPHLRRHRRSYTWPPGELRVATSNS